MTVETRLQKLPFVGPRSFQPGEQLYGREREARQLLDLIIAERIVLLYSPSGAGKSSLIQAVLISSLTREGFQVRPIMRVTNPDVQVADNQSAYRYVIAAQSYLTGHAKEISMTGDGRVDFDTYLAQSGVPAQPVNGQPVADSDKRIRAAPEPADPEILIFDQFEEILSMDPTDVDAKTEFFTQVGTALRKRGRWALFSMREDFVPALDPYVHLIPTGLATRFRLDLLAERAARLAIQKPVLEFGVTFAEDAVSKLVDELRSVRVQQPDGTLTDELGPQVEPVQLQVVCERIWEARDPHSTQITLQDLGQVGSVDDALADYYASRVATIAAQTGTPERTIREWIEHSLIVAPLGIRGQVPQGQAASEGVDDSVVELLEDAHLVRGERGRGARWYELAHDRLIKPIQKSNAEWRATNLSSLQRQAQAWNEQKQPDSLLLRGAAVREAEIWASTRSDVTPAEKAFVAASRAAHDQERVTQRGRQLGLLLGIAVLAVLVVGSFAWTQVQATEKQKELTNEAQQSAYKEQTASALSASAQQTAQGETNRANSAAAAAGAESTRATVAEGVAMAERRIAEANRQAASAAAASASVVGVNPEDSLLLALEAVRSEASIGQPPTAETLSALYRAFGTSRLNATISGYGKAVMSIAYSNDGARIATGSTDGTIRIWDSSNTDTELLTLTDGGGPVLSVAFNNDGTLVGSGNQNGTVAVWTLATSQQSRVARAFGEVHAVAFSPSGDLLAVAADSNSGLFNVASGELVHNLPDSLISLAFNPVDQVQLATGGADETVTVINTSTGDVIREMRMPFKRIASVAFSPNGERLASANNVIAIWDVASGVDLVDLPGPRGGGTNSVAWSPDGKWVAAGDSDRMVRIWQIRRGVPLMTLTGHNEVVRAVAFSPDGTRLASASEDASARLWDVSPNGFHAGLIRDIAFSPDGTQLATASEDGTAQVWDAATLAPRLGPLSLDSGVIYRVAFSPTRAHQAYVAVAAAGAADQVKLAVWDASGARLWDNPGGAEELNDLAFSPDGAYLATASRDQTAQIWDVQKRELVVTRGPRHDGWVYAVAFSPDGSLLATGGADAKARLWEGLSPSPSTCCIESHVLDHAHAVWRLAFSPDGARLAAATSNGTITIWDVHSDLTRPLLGWSAHAGNVNALAFDHDGTRLASVGDDGAVRVWDAASGRIVLTIPRDTPQYAVAFSPDGRTLATGGADQQVRVFPLEPADLVAQAQARVRRSLTNEEFCTYLHERCFGAP